MKWTLEGTPEQNLLVASALNRCTFDYTQVALDIQVPVNWEDLRVYGSVVTNAAEAEVHPHVHVNGDVGHPIEVRSQVLGLAWYSGRVTLDYSLINTPELAAEVFLSEGAHMLDFFWMTDYDRMVIWNALHPDQEDLPLTTNVEDGIPLGSTGEGWFDVGPYRSWIGEAWMGLFTKAYSNVPVTIPFNRTPNLEAVLYTRKNLTPCFSSRTGIVHDQHRGITPVKYHPELDPGMRTCGVCKPFRYV